MTRGAVTLPNGARILGGPFDACPDRADFSVCLDAASVLASRATLLLATPDFGVPEEDALRRAVGALRTATADAPGGIYYVGCRAGLGRTGTFLACLARAGGAVPPGGDPVAWLRAAYHPDAIETPAQEEFARRFRP